MSSEWGPWIRYDGKGQPVGDDVVVDVMLISEINGKHHCRPEPATGWDWSIIGNDGDVIAYRLKKEPVVDVRSQYVTVHDHMGRTEHEIKAVATTTYRDGKLVKIHWEASE